jgi:hypothetical protein
MSTNEVLQTIFVEVEGDHSCVAGKANSIFETSLGRAMLYGYRNAACPESRNHDSARKVLPSSCSASRK